jgi:hypothetical protein
MGILGIIEKVEGDALGEPYQKPDKYDRLFLAWNDAVLGFCHALPPSAQLATGLGPICDKPAVARSEVRASIYLRRDDFVSRGE